MIKKYSIYIILILIILSLLGLLKYNIGEKKRYKSNYKALELENIEIDTKYKGEVIRVKSLELNKRDLRNSTDSLIIANNEIRKLLKIKNKHLNSATSFTTVKIVRDSVFVYDTIIKKVPHEKFSIKDEFFEFNYYRNKTIPMGYYERKSFADYTITLHNFTPLKPGGKPYHFPRKLWIKKAQGATLTCNDPNMNFKNVRVITKKQ